MIVAGIDPGVKPWKTGIALAEVVRGYTLLLDVRLVRDFDEAVSLVVSLNARIVAIDSPLTHATRGLWRSIDMLGKRLGLRLLPPGWNSMRRLIDAIQGGLQRLYKSGVLVLETHPSSVVRVVGVEPARLLKLCFDVLLCNPLDNKDLLDAAISACVAARYATGDWARIETSDGSIWLVDPLFPERHATNNANSLS